MTSFNFCKFHGFGNDYIVAMRDDIEASVLLPELGKNICHRHTGVGADGISILEKLDGDKADYFCEIVNPDGSFAGFSGNGTRCAVSYLYYKGFWSDENLRLETRSGVKNYRLIERKDSGEFWFEAEIGKPKFASDEVPIASQTYLDHVIDHPLTVNNEPLSFSGVNVGNPVACVFVDDFDFDWRTLGRAMETHEMFPDRANIVFVRVKDRENIEIRIWERAAGETSASGTCASGSAVLSAFINKTGRKVAVHSEGGTTLVNWTETDEIVITGRADLAFCGTWPM
jgi:diaminopimelate epimerase